MDEGNFQQKQRFCTNCGVPIFEGQVFCQNCGFKLDAPEEPQAEQQPQVEEPQQAPEEPQVEESQQVPEEPQVEESQQAPNEPQVEEPQQAEQQPQAEEPQQVWQQPQVEEPQQVWQQPQTEDSQQVWQQPQVEEPQQVWQQPQTEEQQAWQQPQADTQQAWQQSQADTQGQAWQFNGNQQFNDNQQFNGNQQYNYNDPMSQQGQQYNYGQAYQQQPYYGDQQGMPNQGVTPPNGPVMNQKPPKPPMDPKKKKKRIILFSCLGAGLVALIVVGILLVYYFSFTRIDASKVYKATYEGINGKGRVSVTLDKKNDKIKDIIKDKGSAKSIQKALCIATIDYEADPNDELSNGDTIKVTVDYDKKTFDKYKIKLSGTTFEIKVEGLKEAESYDVFKDLQVKFNGASGYGTAEIDISNCDYLSSSYVNYSIKNPSEGLKNGDKITVSADVNVTALEESGYTTDVFEKEYTVEGLTELQAYDIFKDIKLAYEGVSPDLTVSVDNSACEASIRDNVYFYIKDCYNKKNGDAVVVRAEFNADAMRELGYEIGSDYANYMIQNQAEYISEIGADAIKTIDSASTTLFDGWMKQNGDGYVYETEIVSSVGEGYVLAEAKNAITNRYFGKKADGNPYNAYAIINKCTYKAVKSDDAKKKETKDLYILAIFRNVVKAADGTYTYETPDVYQYSEDINNLYDYLNSTGVSFDTVNAAQ